MPDYSKTHMLCREVEDHKQVEIKPGDTIYDFRGDECEFHAISRLPEPGRSAKLIVSTFGPSHTQSEPETREAVEGEYYLTCFPGTFIVERTK